MKIIIWGRSSVDRNNAHKQKIESLGAPLVLVEGGAKNTVSFIDVSLIINHDGGVPKTEGIWQIKTSANMSNEPPLNVEKPGKIQWNTFIENIESFFHRIKNKLVVNKEDIATLYALDPQVEKLLGPFVSANPFEESSEAVENLKKVKAELQAYVENHASKRNNSG